MIALSLFDGKSSAFTAMELTGIPVAQFLSSEIDKYAIQVSNAIHPNQTRLGDVTQWRMWDIDWHEIDIVFAGFPCQAWSIAGKQLGDKDERGMLFWTMLDVMKHVNGMRRIMGKPRAHFLIENVKMKKEFEEYITHHTTEALGEVHKILINSALVSAQNRNRYYWTSFPVEQPEDRGIMLVDIIERDPENVTIMSDKFCARNAEILRDDISGKAKNLSAMEYVKNGRQGDYINTEPTVDGETFEQWMRKTKEHGGTREEFDALISQRGRGNNPGGLRALDGKTPTLTACHWEQNNKLLIRDKSRTVRVGGNGSPPESKQCWDNVLDSKVHYRKLTPRECFQL